MDASEERALIGPMSWRQYAVNMGKALIGRPTIYGTSGRLTELAVMVKSLMEETASPLWRQQQEEPRKVR